MCVVIGGRGDGGGVRDGGVYGNRGFMRWWTEIASYISLLSDVYIYIIYKHLPAPPLGTISGLLIG